MENSREGNETQEGIIMRKWLYKHPGVHKLVKNAVRIARMPTTIKQNNYYQKWLIEQLQNYKEKRLSIQPKLSIIVPVYNTPSNFLDEMIESVINQSYANWELIIIDDCSTEHNVQNIIEKYKQRDKRIKSVSLRVNHGISGATNEGIKAAEGDFVSLLDHDDILRPGALYSVAEAICEGDYDFIYTDEDKIDKRGRRYQPFVKPGWNPELLFSVNYITHFATIRKKLIDEVGAEDSRYNGAQDWELFFRCTSNIPPKKIHHIPRVLYSWRVHEKSTAKEIGIKPYVVNAQKMALQSHLNNSTFKVKSIKQDENFPAQWVVRYEVESSPKVNAIFYNNGVIVSKGEREPMLKNLNAYNSTNNEFPENSLESDFTLLVFEKLKTGSSSWIKEMIADAQRSEIGIVMAKSRASNVIENLCSILPENSVDLIKNLDHRNVSRHFYFTTRYNINVIKGCSAALIQTNKLKRVIEDFNAKSDLEEISTNLVKHGYRNLYNPYIKVLK